MPEAEAGAEAASAHESDRPEGPRLGLLVAGGFAMVLAVLAMLAVGIAIDAGAIPADWVLYALPACGLLGFAGLAAIVTAFVDRA